MSDVAWKRNLNCRYNDFRTNVLSLQNINRIIDSLANELRDAQGRNFTRWNILGKYVWPNPQPIPTSFTGEVDKLKNWVVKRLDFLDSNLGPCEAPVPVSLFEFVGTHSENANLLTWKTTNEISNRYFYCERSVVINHMFRSGGRFEGTMDRSMITFEDNGNSKPVSIID